MKIVVTGAAGFIGSNMFSTLVLMGIVTTLLAPAMFNRAMPLAQLTRYRNR